MQLHGTSTSLYTRIVRIADIDRHRHIGALRDRFSDRPSIAETQPVF